MGKIDTNALSPEEWAKLRPHLAPKHWEVYFWLLWETGIRPGEGLNLTRDDIFQERGHWYIRVHRLKKKNVRIDTISLPHDLGEALWGLTSPRARFKPFPYRIQSANEAIKRAAVRAGIRVKNGKSTLHPHLHRHGFGRRWARADLGYSATDHMAVLKEMLGHERIATTEIYFRPSDDEIKGGWERLRDHEDPRPKVETDGWKEDLKRIWGLT